MDAITYTVILTILTPCFNLGFKYITHVNLPEPHDKLRQYA